MASLSSQGPRRLKRPLGQLEINRSDSGILTPSLSDTYPVTPAYLPRHFSCILTPSLLRRRGILTPSLRRWLWRRASKLAAAGCCFEPRAPGAYSPRRDPEASFWKVGYGTFRLIRTRSSSPLRVSMRFKLQVSHPAGHCPPPPPRPALLQGPAASPPVSRQPGEAMLLLRPQCSCGGPREPVLGPAWPASWRQRQSLSESTGSAGTACDAEKLRPRGAEL